jgi:hypothetical protein
MAAADSLNAEPGAFQESVALDRLKRVVAAAWGVAARGRHPAGTPLVAADQEDSDSSAHRALARTTKSRASSVIRSQGASAHEGPRITT